MLLFVAPAFGLIFSRACDTFERMAFVVRAVNTAAESENLIHDNRVAAEYGFRGGLVPGVTIYGYMASAVIAEVGSQWMTSGGMHVRFFEPFYEGEQVAVTIDGDRVEAGARAKGTFFMDGEAVQGEVPHSERPPAAIAAGEVLASMEKTLDLSTPGMAAPLDASIDGFAHPAILLALANEILVNNFTLGPWIHASSEVRNLGRVGHGERVKVRASIIDAYERKGREWVVLDVAIAATHPVARIRHTAIWKLRK